MCFAQLGERIPFQEKHGCGSGFARQPELAGGALPWSKGVSVIVTLQLPVALNSGESNQNTACNGRARCKCAQAESVR